MEQSDCSTSMASNRGDSSEQAQSTISAGEGVDPSSTLRFNIPGELATLAQQRVMILVQLDRLDGRRHALRQSGELSDDVTAELNRQNREIHRFPPADAIKANMKKMETRLAAIRENDEQPVLAEALEIGCLQLALFEQRDQLTDQVLNTAVKCAFQEPLFQLLNTYGCEPASLYGWTFYALALERFKQQTMSKLQSVQQQIAQIPVKKKDAASDDTGELTATDEARLLNRVQTAVARELKAIEPVMVSEFWRIYEEAAVLLCSQELSDDEELCLRGMLRYGLILQKPYILSPEIINYMVEQCRNPVTGWDFNVEATHVMYADEYIDLAGKGLATPSFDEDMELNDRGSDVWVLDKRWRKVIYGKVVESALQQTRDMMNHRREQWQQAIKALESQIAGLDRKDLHYRDKRNELQEQVQANKVEIARYDRGLELIDQKHLPNELELALEASKKLHSMSVKMTPEAIARREATGVRRYTKLCNKLKEPFIPFVMRERFKFVTGTINDRETLLNEIEEIEKRDPNIFREILIHAKNQQNRIYVRYCPYIVLMPSIGMMSLSWNPRSSAEVGRIAIPVINMRPGTLTRMLYQVMADFRYDTSKAAAGKDYVTSDTLVAAYATARWNYRKRDKDIREKAAIYNEEKDRQNWRRHYELYITSAMESGKKLFFKCPEVYEAVLKYMGLPDGIPRLS